MCRSFALWRHTSGTTALRVTSARGDTTPAERTAKSVRRIQSVGRAVRASSHPQGARRSSSRSVGGCTFDGRSATTGSLAVISLRGRWPVPQGSGVIDPVGVGLSADRGRLLCAVGCGAGPPGVRSICGDCRQCPLTASVRRVRFAAAGSGSVANRSVTCPVAVKTPVVRHWVVGLSGARPPGVWDTPALGPCGSPPRDRWATKPRQYAPTPIILPRQRAGSCRKSPSLEAHQAFSPPKQV
jgi:hypothetical protein